MRIELPILLPVWKNLQAHSGTYQLLVGRHSTRWDNYLGKPDPLAASSYDVVLDGVILARIYDGAAYPGKLHVSMNRVRWRSGLPQDHYDTRFHDFVGNGSFDETFARTVKQCEAIHKFRGGWNAQLTTATMKIAVRDTIPNRIGENARQSMMEAIRPGSKVTIMIPNGKSTSCTRKRSRIVQQWKKATGRAVMRSSAGGWVLNMGGKHGTPGLASVENVVAIKQVRSATVRG